MACSKLSCRLLAAIVQCQVHCIRPANKLCPSLCPRRRDRWQLWAVLETAAEPCGRRRQWRGYLHDGCKWPSSAGTHDGYKSCDVWSICDGVCTFQVQEPSTSHHRGPLPV